MRRTAASTARSGRAAGTAARGRAAPAFLGGSGDELVDSGRSARGAGYFLRRAHDELLEGPSACGAFVFEYGHPSYLSIPLSRPRFSIDSRFAAAVGSFLDRSPIPQVWDIQVDTPRRGRRNLMTTIHTAKKIRTLTIVRNQPFMRVCDPGSARASGFPPLPSPSSIGT
jgi:hypothetical protein